MLQSDDQLLESSGRRVVGRVGVNQGYSLYDSEGLLMVQKYGKLTS